MSELCLNCTLRSELCAVQAKVGPMAAEAAIVGEAAETFYRAAADLEADGLRAREIAKLELEMHDSTPDETRDAEEGRRLAKGLIDAIAMYMGANVIKHDAKRARAKSSRDILENSLCMAEDNLSMLDHDCTKGPKDNGSCRAPRRTRQNARQTLKSIEQSLPDTTADTT